MNKLSTKLPKTLMTPPMWIMPRSEPPSTGVLAWIENVLFWIEELFTEKPPETTAICGTPFITSDRLKSADKFFKKHDQDKSSRL